MKTYKASQELVDILLKNGFTETTKETYPEHFKRMKKQGEYNPGSMKRKFNFEKSKRDYILMDYSIIIPYYRSSANGPDMNSSLTEDQLKSIIVFFKLSAGSKYSWFMKGQKNIIDIHIFIKDIEEYSRFKQIKKEIAFNKEVKELFERVII